MRLLEQGNTVRRVGATQMNEQSSRSHSCFTIKVEQKLTTELSGGVTREQVVSAKLNLVDLAGSERASKTGASGQTLKEGAKINLSLMTLGTVINALAAGDKKVHIPYRDSQLTRLLQVGEGEACGYSHSQRNETLLVQESLGGNAATVMIAAVSPADYNYDETLGTLKYANRAKSIENIVTRNEDVNERMIRELKEQIEKLKAELQQGGSGGTVPDPELEHKLKAMEEEQRNAWEEREKLSLALAAERQANMNNVISVMMRDIKEQKIDHMKKIKLLSLEKSDLIKSQKATKEKVDTLKGMLEKKMAVYNDLKVEYEASRPKDDDSEEVAATKKIRKAELAQEMQSLLAEIENVKTKWVEKKDVLKVLKSKVATIEENIDSAKADLVVAHGLLDQNDKLRQRIYEEERAKVKEQLADEINAAKVKLDEERRTVREGIVAEVADEVARINQELLDCQEKLSIAEEEVYILSTEKEELKEYSDKLESRLADAEANFEATEATMRTMQDELNEKNALAARVAELEAENTALLESFEKERNEWKRQAAAQLQVAASANEKGFEEQKYMLFKSMMDTFEEERRGMEMKYKDLQRLLNQATKVRVIGNMLHEYIGSLPILCQNDCMRDGHSFSLLLHCS